MYSEYIPGLRAECVGFLLAASEKNNKIMSNVLIMFLASQMFEKSYDNTSCEASLNISQDTLCSGKSFPVII